MSSPTTGARGETLGSPPVNADRPAVGRQPEQEGRDLGPQATRRRYVDEAVGTTP